MIDLRKVLLVFPFISIFGCNVLSWIQSPSEDPRSELESGRAYLEHGDFEKAIYHLNRAISLSEDPVDRNEAVYLRGVAVLRMEKVRVLSLILPGKIDDLYRAFEGDNSPESVLATIAGSIDPSEMARILPILRYEEVSAIDGTTGVGVEDGEARFVGGGLGPKANLTAGVVHSLIAAASVADLDGDGSLSDPEKLIFGEVAEVMERTSSPSKMREFYGRKVSEILGIPYGSDGCRNALDGIRARVISEISIARVNLEMARDSLAGEEGALGGRIEMALNALSTARGVFSW